MKITRTALAVVGTLMVVMGLLWAAQGSGIFPYPQTSPMINQSAWVTRGAVLGLAGIAVAWLSRRLTR